MKFDELDTYVEELFTRPAHPPREENLHSLPAISLANAAGHAPQVSGDSDELYYWREPDEGTSLPGTILGSPAGEWEGTILGSPAGEWERSQPLSLWGMIKGLLLLAAGLLLIVSLSEAGLI
jgi:hypothetical protein